jgi:ornithine decarboxylase
VGTHKSTHNNIFARNGGGTAAAAGGKNGGLALGGYGMQVAVGNSKNISRRFFSSSSTTSSSSSTFLFEAPATRRSAVLDIVRAQIPAHKDAFYVVDLAELAYKHAEWCTQLPRVRPFYAVKCNDDPVLVKTLASLGAGFDCASKGEMSMVLGLGVKPDDIIFAHPAKQPSHIHYALSKGVRKMTFDNEDELRKIAQHHPNAQVVLRILADDSASVCRLGLKFGAPLSSVRRLLTVAKELKLDVLGVSYHVGSGNGRAEAFADAVRDARTAFDIGRELGLNMRVLDIGGGFPGSEAGIDLADAETAHAAAQANPDPSNPYAGHPSFRAIAGHVRKALDKHFPVGCGVDLIAEPGRFYVKSTHVLAVNVVGKRATTDEAGAGTRWNLYVNDGLYGSFNCVLYDHTVAYPDLLVRKTGAQANTEVDLNAVKAAADRARASGGGTKSVSSAAASYAEAVNTAAAARDAAAATAAAVAAAAASSASRTTTGSVQQQQARGMATTATTPATLAPPPVHVPAMHVAPHGDLYATTLWGPTCDSMDKITDAALMPEVHVGDWLVFENMGAYTIAGSCKFNGFPISTKVYRHPDGRLTVQDEETHA